MNKKIIFVVGLAALLLFPTKVYANEKCEIGFSQNESVNIFTKNFVIPLDNQYFIVNPQLFETKYVVIVPNVIIRSGPGDNYSAIGTLYYGDYVMVSSIVSGWAKFRMEGNWRYVPISSLELWD